MRTGFSPFPQLRLMRDAVVDQAAVGAKTAIEWLGIYTNSVANGEIGVGPHF